MSIPITIGAILIASLTIFIRLKAIKKPATVKRIILPPLFMSTGLLMFFYEPTRLPILLGIGALSIGAIFSILLIKTSTFEIKNNQIFLKRSKAFIFILVGLLAVRIVFKLLIGDSINFEELGGMFFLLAYGMIIPWRISMYFSFRKTEKLLTNNQDKPIVPVEHKKGFLTNVRATF